MVQSAIFAQAEAPDLIDAPLPTAEVMVATRVLL